MGKVPEEIELFRFGFLLRHASGGFNGDPADPGTGPGLGALVVGADLTKPPLIEGGPNCPKFGPLDDDLLPAHADRQHFRFTCYMVPALQLRQRECHDPVRQDESDHRRSLIFGGHFAPGRRRWWHKGLLTGLVQDAHDRSGGNRGGLGAEAEPFAQRGAR